MMSGGLCLMTSGAACQVLSCTSNKTADLSRKRFLLSFLVLSFLVRCANFFFFRHGIVFNDFICALSFHSSYIFFFFTFFFSPFHSKLCGSFFFSLLLVVASFFLKKKKKNVLSNFYQLFRVYFLSLPYTVFCIVFDFCV